MVKPPPAMERSASTSRPAEKNVGVIGLGIIGRGIAAHLRRTGYSVFVWNRSPRAVPNFVGSPGELAEVCNTIQIFVSDDQALLQTIEQLSEHLTPRHMILAHSTVAPDSMRAAAQIVERRRARFVEASFTGSKPAAEKGELIYYVGGTDSALREARPILQASSKEIIEIGAVGDASAVKIATNMITAASVQAAAEALGLVRALGLPVEKFIEAMRPNASYSGTLAMKVPKMISRDFDPQFSVKHMLKDMQLACHIALSHYLDLGVTSAARDQLLEQTQWGHGDDDYSVVARKYLQDSAPESYEERQGDSEEEQQAQENKEIISSPKSDAENMSPDAAAVDTSEQPLLRLAEASAATAPITPPSRRGLLKQLLSRLSPRQE